MYENLSFYSTRFYFFWLRNLFWTFLFNIFFCPFNVLFACRPPSMPTQRHRRLLMDPVARWGISLSVMFCPNSVLTLCYPKTRVLIRGNVVHKCVNFRRVWVARITTLDLSKEKKFVPSLAGVVFLHIDHVHMLPIFLQPDPGKLVLGRHWMHMSYMHPVTSENQFHCTRLYTL